MNRIIVLGSNSFSGSYLVDELLKDNSNSVLGISRSDEIDINFSPYKSNANLFNFKFCKADIRNTNRIIGLLEEFSPEYIVNYAAMSEVFPSNEHPEDYYATNLSAVVNLCSYLRKQKYLKKYVQISTCEVYGSCDYMVLESERLFPTTPYAVSKAAVDMHLLSLYRHFNFPVTITRSTSVYGKYQQLYKVIPKTIINLVEGNKLQVHGNGQMIRTFVHVRDVAKGVISAMKIGYSGEVYNFSSENRFPIILVMKYIADAMNKPFDFEFTDDRHKQDRDYTLSYVKAKQMFGWEPAIRFEEGIKETIDWVVDIIGKVPVEKRDYIFKV